MITPGRPSGLPGVAVGSLVVMTLLVPLVRPLVGERAGAPRRHEVEIRGFEFRPRMLDVAVGDTVVWINRDAVPHTATAADGSWDSDRLDRNASWVWVPTERGAWDYTCIYHRSMKAGIRVKAPSRGADGERRD